MVIVVTLTVGMVFWITCWALGVKSFDAFMVTGMLLVGAAAWYVARPYLKRFLGREPA